MSPYAIKFDQGCFTPISHRACLITLPVYPIALSPGINLAVGLLRLAPGFHAQRYAFTGNVYLQYGNHDLLIHFDYLAGIAHEPVC